MSKKKWVNQTADDVVTISGSIWNNDIRTVASAVNYNAQILKDVLNRIAELEKHLKPRERSERMTLNEAIERFENNAEFERRNGNLQGCLEFRLLVDWLQELKEYREILKAESEE